jgi:hypothetical protein
MLHQKRRDPTEGVRHTERIFLMLGTFRLPESDPRAARRRPSRRKSASRSRLAQARLRRLLLLEPLEDRTLPSASILGTVIPNTNVTNSASAQQEPSVAVDPNNPNHVVMAYMDYGLKTNGFAGIGVKVYDAVHNTWSAESEVPLPADDNMAAGNPVVKFDGQGHFFVAYMAATFQGTDAEGNSLLPGIIYDTSTATVDGQAVNRRVFGMMANNGIFVAEGSDDGMGDITWVQTTAVASHLYTPPSGAGVTDLGNFSSQVPFDVLPDLAIDTNKANPTYGNIYVTWTRYYPTGQFVGESTAGGGSDIMFAGSSDGGQTWTTRLQSHSRYQDTSSAAVSPGVATVTPGSLVPFVQVGTNLIIDQGTASQETVTVTAVTSSTFTATFALAHAANFTITSVPVQVSAILDPLTGDNDGGTEGRGFASSSKVTVGPAGDIYVSMFAGQRFPVFYSTDAGATFRTPDPFTPISYPFGDEIPIPSGFPTTLPIPNTKLSQADPFRTLPQRDIVADPTHPGRVYAVEAIVVPNINLPGPPGGSPPAVAVQIDFAWSNDNGQNWSTTFTVGTYPPDLSDIPPALAGQSTSGWVGYFSALNDANGGHQLSFDSLAQLANEVIANVALPQLSVDTQGNITVVWYDSRHDPANTKLDVYGTTGTISADGSSATFSANYRITTQNFNPNVGAPTDGAGNPYIGDYIGLASANGTVYAAWTDSRSNSQNIEFATYSVTPPPSPFVNRYDPEDLSSPGIDLGSISVGTILPRLSLVPGQDEWYQLTSAANGTLTVNATPAAPGADLQVQLYDLSDTTKPPVTGTAVTDSSGQLIEVTLSYAGAVSGQHFLVRISGGLVPNFSLFLKSLTADLGADIQDTLTGNITPSGQSIYRLVVPVNGSLAVTLTGAAGLTAQVVSSDGQTVLNSGTQFIVPVNQNDVLLLEVLGTDPSATGLYQLQFENLDQFETSQPPSLFYPVAGGTPSGIAAADLTGNGKTDLVVTSNVTDAVSVLTGNGDGTFQAVRQYAIGPGVSSQIVRNPVVADLNGDGIPDIVATNFSANDVSVLLGTGDGTFLPERRFDANIQPDSVVVGDFDGRKYANGKPILDLAVLNRTSTTESLVILMGRGDGTFAPPLAPIPIPFAQGAFPVLVGDLTGNGLDDLVVFGTTAGKFEVLLSKGDGTFTLGGTYTVGEAIDTATLGDVRGNGRLDVIVGAAHSGNVDVFLSRGNGTFRPAPVVFPTIVPGPGENIGVFGLAVADYANVVLDPKTGAVTKLTLGQSDGVPDILVSVANQNASRPPQLMVIPAPALFGPGGLPGALPVATLTSAGQIVTGDFTGSVGNVRITDGGSGYTSAPTVTFSAPPPGGTTATGTATIADGVVIGVTITYGGSGYTTAPTISFSSGTASGSAYLSQDIAAIEQGGVEVVYGTPPNTAASDTQNLGTVEHYVGQPQAIVTGHEDAYFTLTVPTEAASNGPEVLDFSALFQDTQGGGLQMTVTDAASNVLGSGDRFRVVADQGAVLTVHIFGVAGAGAGAYTLDIDVLPQVISAQAESPIPGGPATSIVLTFQGDRLDPTAASDPANYQVLALQGGFGPRASAVIPLASAPGAQPVVYNPGANVDVVTGLHYATAVRQTVTLLFDKPLPAGDYEIIVSPNVTTPAFGDSEAGQLAEAGSVGGHTVVSVAGNTISNSSTLSAPGLVTPSGTPGSLSQFVQGTPFLTQLENDLNAILDQQLVKAGDDPNITNYLNQEILARFAALYKQAGAAGQSLPSFLISWFDPVSIDVKAPHAQSASYSTETSSVSSNVANTYVNVSGNVELVVMANASGSYQFGVADVAADARAGAVVLSEETTQVLSFTDAIRAGADTFTVEVASAAGPAGAAASGTTVASATAGTTAGSSTGQSAVASALTPEAAVLATILLTGVPANLGPAESAPSAGGGAAPAGAAAAALPFVSSGIDGSWFTSLSGLRVAVDRVFQEWAPGLSVMARDAWQFMAASLVRVAGNTAGEVASALTIPGLSQLADRGRQWEDAVNNLIGSGISAVEGFARKLALPGSKPPVVGPTGEAKPQAPPPIEDENDEEPEQGSVPDQSRGEVPPPADPQQSSTDWGLVLVLAGACHAGWRDATPSGRERRKGRRPAV